MTLIVEVGFFYHSAEMQFVYSRALDDRVDKLLCINCNEKEKTNTHTNIFLYSITQVLLMGWYLKTKVNKR